MIRRSGVRSLVAVSKVARETPRRDASGHSPAMQFEKFAAAARIASEVINGCPDAPDSPLHSRVPEAVGGAAVAAAGWPNTLRRSNPCAPAGPATSTAASKKLLVQIGFDMATPVGNEARTILTQEQTRNLVRRSLMWRNEGAKPRGRGFSGGNAATTAPIRCVRRSCRLVGEAVVCSGPLR